MILRIRTPPARAAPSSLLSHERACSTLGIPSSRLTTLMSFDMRVATWKCSYQTRYHRYPGQVDRQGNGAGAGVFTGRCDQDAPVRNCAKVRFSQADGPRVYVAERDGRSAVDHCVSWCSGRQFADSRGDDCLNGSWNSGDSPVVYPRGRSLRKSSHGHDEGWDVSGGTRKGGMWNPEPPLQPELDSNVAQRRIPGCGGR